MITRLNNTVFNIKNFFFKLKHGFDRYAPFNIGDDIARRFLILTQRKYLNQYWGTPEGFEHLSEWHNCIEEMRFAFFHRIFIVEECKYWTDEKGRTKWVNKWKKDLYYCYDLIEQYVPVIFPRELDGWQLDFHRTNVEGKKGVFQLHLNYKNVNTGEVKNKLEHDEDFKDYLRNRAEVGMDLFHKYFWNLWD